MSFRGVPALAVFAFFLLGPGEALEAASFRIVNGPYGSGRIYVSCQLDEARERCVVDTGSLFSLVADSPPFTEYPSTGKLRFQSASGIPHEAEKITIRRVALGGAVFTNMTFGRITRGDKLQTTLGLNILGSRPVSFLFRDEASLYFGRQAATLEMLPLPAQAAGLLIIPIEIGGSPARALWDTGAELTAMDAKYVAAHHGDFVFVREIGNVVDGNDQRIAARLFRARSIRIGHRTFRNVNVLAVDLSTLHQAAGGEVQAVIGFNIIRKTDWFFDRERAQWGVR